MAIKLNTIIIIILVLLAIGVGIYGVVNEKWQGMPQTTTKVERVVTVPGMGGMKNNFYEVPGLYQAELSPRFMSGDYGAAIRFNQPDYQNMAVPNQPLGYYNNLVPNVQQDIKETFTQNNFGQTKSQNVVSDMAREQQQYVEASDLLPVANMSSGGLQVLNQDGMQQQVINYDRYMFANQKSRLASQGDMLRGDLPIPPPVPSGPASAQGCGSTGNWFIPSASAQIDLQRGALAAMGGEDNQTNRQLQALVSNAAGQNSYYGSGISYINQSKGSLTAGQGDIQFTSFP
jgi:hypothetical protein